MSSAPLTGTNIFIPFCYGGRVRSGVLKQLRLQSVKSFLSTAEICFAPVTVVAGTNSSGKSTIFQTLLLLKQAFEHPALSLDGMHLNGPQASVGSYHDWCSKHARTNVCVSVTLTNDYPIKRNIGISKVRLTRRVAAPVFWWIERGLLSRRPLSNAQISGRFSMTFVPNAESPNDARLKDVEWHSTTRQDDDGASYTMTINPAMPSEEELDAAEIESESDLEKYRYTMKATRTWPRGTLQETTLGPVLCAVEGLLPTSILNPTEDRAAVMTIVDHLVSTFSWIRSNSGFEFPNKPAKPTLQKEIFEALHSPTEHRLKVLENRATKADGPRAIEILSAANEIRLARLLVDKLNPSREKDLESRASLATDALFKMILSLIPPPLSNYDSATDNIDSFPHSSAEALSSRHPPLRPSLKFLLEVYKRCSDAATRDQIKFGIRMAENHARIDRPHLQPTTIDSVFRTRASTGTNPPMIITGAPSENTIRRYFVEGLFHLGPLRDEPRVLYVADVPLAPHDVGKRGQRAISCLREFGTEKIEFLMPSPLIEERVTLKTESVALSDIVSRWGQYLGLFDGIQIDTSEKYGTIVKVNGTMDGADISPDLTNVGVGVSQILPILVLCATMPVGGCALIEQPELHLHPSVQSRLAVFFAACALSNRQVVLESHSEHLINRLRLLIAYRTLSPEHVSIAFIEKDEFGATVAPISIKADGTLERWPRGFLDEAEKVLSILMRAHTRE